MEDRGNLDTSCQLKRKIKRRENVRLMHCCAAGIVLVKKCTKLLLLLALLVLATLLYLVVEGQSSKSHSNVCVCLLCILCIVSIQYLQAVNFSGLQSCIVPRSKRQQLSSCHQTSNPSNCCCNELYWASLNSLKQALETSVDCHHHYIICALQYMLFPCYSSIKEVVAWYYNHHAPRDCWGAAWCSPAGNTQLNHTPRKFESLDCHSGSY